MGLHGSGRKAAAGAALFAEPPVKVRGSGRARVDQEADQSHMASIAWRAALASGKLLTGGPGLPALRYSLVFKR